MTECPNKHQVSDSQKFCGQCGAGIVEPAESPPAPDVEIIGTTNSESSRPYGETAVPANGQPRHVAEWRRWTPPIAFGAAAITLLIAGLFLGLLPAYTGDRDGDPYSCGSAFIVEDEFGQFGFCESEADLSIRRAQALSLLAGGVVFGAATLAWRPNPSSQYDEAEPNTSAAGPPRPQ